jgi:hypothetical protein
MAKAPNEAVIGDETIGTFDYVLVGAEDQTAARLWAKSERLAANVDDRA